MASCQTPRSPSTAPYASLTVEQTGSTNTNVTFTCTVKYYSATAASTNGNDRAWSVTAGGTTIKSGGYNINGKTGTKTVATFTHVVNKTTTAQTITFGLSFTFDVKWSGTQVGTKTASCSVSVPAKPSYTVAYNANGGSGAPGSQTKWYGTALTLSTAKPTRTGYSFLGWSTSKTATSATYAAGGSYTANAAATLYAVWKANTYKISYNANGGSGAPAAQTKAHGSTLVLSSKKPTRANYTFLGWSTSATATTATYAAGASYTANAAATLYAVWKLAYTKPIVSDVIVYRSRQEDYQDDSGTYVMVKFAWSTFHDVSSVSVTITSSAGDIITDNPTVSGKSGTYYNVLGGGSISTDRTYTVKIVVADSGGNTPISRTVGGTQFAIDVMTGGKGIAFGKPAENKEYADFAYKVRLRDNMLLQAGKSIYSRDADDTTSLSLLYVNGSNNTVLGYGGYYNQIGTTNIYGNSVNFTSRNGVFVGGCQIAKNKVLWSGKYYMSESQTATLSEKISDQANGVVLIWSEYDPETFAAVNANFNTQFIPKYFVSEFASKGVGTTVISATLNVIASKYVYVSDTSIAGYSTNDTGATTVNSGLTRTSKNFVLRAVIGV